MKTWLTGLLGFFLILLCHTLFGSLSFFTTLIVYSVTLYLLFFSSTVVLAFSLLIGVTFGCELLGNTHFGQAGFLAAVIIFLYYLLRQRFRFTSVFIRYSLALPLALVSCRLLLYSWSEFWSDLEAIALFYLIFIALAYLFSNLKQPTDYELL